MVKGGKEKNGQDKKTRIKLHSEFIQLRRLLHMCKGHVSVPSNE